MRPDSSVAMAPAQAGYAPGYNPGMQPAMVPAGYPTGKQKTLLWQDLNDAQRRWVKLLVLVNILLALGLIAQGVVMAAAGNNDYRVPVAHSFLDWAGETPVDGFSRYIYFDTWPLAQVVSTALFAAALQMILTPLLFTIYWRSLVMYRTSPLRWIGFGIANSWMLWMTAMLTGWFDIFALITIFLFSFTFYMLFWSVEMGSVFQGKKARVMSWLLLWIPTIGVLVGVFSYFIGATVLDSAALPGYVYAAVIITCFFYLWFTAWGLLSIVTRFNIFVVELGFLVTQFLFLSAVGWIIFGGAAGNESVVEVD